MMRRTWIALALALPGLIGCSGDGPPEFTRTLLQARSELVDSLSLIVDDKSAMTTYKPYKDIYKDRMETIGKQIDVYRRLSDPLFDKPKRDTFTAKKLEPADRESMTTAGKAQLDFIASIVPTEIRLNRELQRLERIGHLIMLEKARDQLAANKPVSVDFASSAPNLAQILFDFKDRKIDPNILFLPRGLTKAHLTKLEMFTPDEIDRLLIDAIDMREGNQSFKAPPLPAYPQWAVDVDRRARLGLTTR